LVHDVAGAGWPTTSVPRRPRLTLRIPGGAEGDPEPVLLVRGEPSSALLADLERAPLTATTLALIVPCTSNRDADDVTLVPDAPLELAASYTLLLAGWARRRDGTAHASVLAFTVTVAQSRAGAMLVGTFPPDRASGLPVEMPRVLLALDDDVSGTEDVHVVRADGEPVPLSRRTIPCEEAGFDAPACIALDLERVLEPGTLYALVVGEGLRDRGGASIGPLETSFVTGTGAQPPTMLLAQTCAPDETSAEGACLLVQDDTVRARMTTTQATYGFAEMLGIRYPFFAPRGEIALVIRELPPATPHELTLFATDARGDVLTRTWPVTTLETMPAIVIAEVRHDPSGPEPGQEYVELWNTGAAEADLSSFTISDRVDATGDVLPLGTRVEPFGRLLLVADAFEALHPEDVPVPQGVRLVRIGSALATSGISNGGEPIFLRDALGRRVAEAPAIASRGEGRCVVRAHGEGRVALPGEYVVLEGAPCTPGY
jgi:hypothetical protein